jgi:hypothetical protein
MPPPRPRPRVTESRAAFPARCQASENTGRAPTPPALDPRVSVPPRAKLSRGRGEPYSRDVHSSRKPYPSIDHQNLAVVSKELVPEIGETG